MNGRYLMVLPVPAFQSSATSFDIESAFAQHLRTLREKLGPLAQTIVLAAPALDADARAKLTLDTVRAEEGIVFVPVYDARVGRFGYLAQLPRIAKLLREEIAKADVVHTGVSPLFWPFEIVALGIARELGKTTICVTDIDQRNSARMNYQTGEWSLREYLTSKLLHETNLHLQHLWAARNVSLLLLKGKRMAADYGGGRPNVKAFWDSAFETRHLIAPDRLEAKARAVLDRAQPLRVVYFGRLVPYKGIDHMLRAVRGALDLGAKLHMQIIGEGPQRAELEALSRELRVDAHVTFTGAVPFGEPLFEKLYDAHVLLAAALREDTPRSALDACAAGEALVAYDTYYYRELADSGAPVEIVKWRDHAAMGRALADLERDRERLARLLRSARSFAEPNTQEAWLERRVRWTQQLFE
jgi:glycosyltransferase involved in cell wall biosynthesis